jgi:hypothetical protein
MTMDIFIKQSIQTVVQRGLFLESVAKLVAWMFQFVGSYDSLCRFDAVIYR